jgi:hypothetical protein
MIIAFFLSLGVNLVVLAEEKSSFLGGTGLIFNSVCLCLLAVLHIMLMLRYRWKDLMIRSSPEFQQTEKPSKMKPTVYNVTRYVDILHEVFEFCGGFVFHLMISVLGFYGGDWFFTLHMIVSINIFKASQYIVSAVKKHAMMFFATIVYLVFIVNMFSHIAAEFFQDEFDLGDIRPCDTAYDCFMYNIYLGKPTFNFSPYNFSLTIFVEQN